MKNAMRNICLIALTLTLSTGLLQAKKVKFMVNMTGLVKNAFGIHLTSNFQTLAGYAGGDWNSSTTEMFQEPGDTNVYSLIVDIPAMAEYEFKFVNGIQFYEVEFVPIESRVGYNFNDNRWIFIDSLADDTTIVGPLMFSGNAPIGQYCARFLVDMQGQTISNNGVHVAGSFQNWNPTTMRLYSFGGTVYEYIGYSDTLVTAIEFKYINGNAWGDDETVPGACAVNNNRSQAMPKDTLLPTVCFASCVACPAVAVDEALAAQVLVYPNPARESATLQVQGVAGAWRMDLLDLQGRVVRRTEGLGEGAIRIERGGLEAGLYCLRVRTEDGNSMTQKWLLQ